MSHVHDRSRFAIFENPSSLPHSPRVGSFVNTRSSLSILCLLWLCYLLVMAGLVPGGTVRVLGIPRHHLGSMRGLGGLGSTETRLCNKVHITPPVPCAYLDDTDHTEPSSASATRSSERTLLPPTYFLSPFCHSTD